MIFFYLLIIAHRTLYKLAPPHRAPLATFAAQRAAHCCSASLSFDSSRVAGLAQDPCPLGLTRRCEGRAVAWLFVVLLFLFIPKDVAAVSDATRVYLRAQTPDAWVVMARAVVGDAPVVADVARLSCDGVLGLSKCILASTAIGKHPKEVFGVDYVATLKTAFDGRQFGTVTALNDDAWAILALRSAGVSMNDKAIVESSAFLLQRQNADGGWGYATPGESDTNDTAAIMMALIESGEPTGSVVIVKAVEYLRSQQNTDGGFSYDRDQFGSSDGASDAWVISALKRVGENVPSWTKNGKTPLDHLNTLQQSDGSYAWRQGQSGTLSITAWAAIALAGASYPVRSLMSDDTNNATTSRIRHLGAPLPSEPATSVYSKPSSRVTIDVSARDSDGDGYPDAVEIEKGYDPLDPIPCPKRLFSTAEKNVYGGMRLASIANERCRSVYLQEQLRKRRNGRTIKSSPQRWTEVVNAYLYGGYSIDAIAAWKDL